MKDKVASVFDVVFWSVQCWLLVVVVVVVVWVEKANSTKANSIMNACQSSLAFAFFPGEFWSCWKTVQKVVVGFFLAKIVSNGNIF